MPKVSQIGVKYRGGFRGSYIDISQLIDRKIKLDVMDFTCGQSCVRNCETYCRMQIRINGALHVTWHSSEVLTTYLEDCKKHEQATGDIAFPIEDCIVTIGEDRAYYLQDAPSDSFVPTKEELERIVNKANKNKNRR